MLITREEMENCVREYKGLLMGAPHAGKCKKHTQFDEFKKFQNST